MNIRNAKHVAGGLINCEYEHPQLGWIPYTASPNDVEQIGRDIYAIAAAGEVAEADAPVVVVPESISPRQFRQALTASGLRSAIESAIAGSDQDTKDWYEFSTSFERHHPVVVAMVASLGYTEQQADAVWTLGASL